MLDRVRGAIRWGRSVTAPASPNTPLFGDHDELRDIARHLGRTKVELDRSLLVLRSWARDLSRRLADSRSGLGRADELRALGETVGGLAHNLNIRLPVQKLRSPLTQHRVIVGEKNANDSRHILSL